MPIFIWCIGIAAIFVSILAGISWGIIDIPFTELLAILRQGIGFSQGEPIAASHMDIIWELRLPRVLLAAAAGISLSIAGTVMQASVQNPLAEPFLLGIASGAALGAVAGIMLRLQAGVPLMAFAGACLATGIVFF